MNVYLFFCIKDLSLLVTRPSQLLLLEVGVVKRFGDLHARNVDFGVCGNDKLLVCPTQRNSVQSKGSYIQKERMHVIIGHKRLSSHSYNLNAQNEILTGDKQETSWELLQEHHTLKMGAKKKRTTAWIQGRTSYKLNWNNHKYLMETWTCKLSKDASNESSGTKNTLIRTNEQI